MLNEGQRSPKERCKSGQKTMNAVSRCLHVKNWPCYIEVSVIKMYYVYFSSSKSQATKTRRELLLLPSYGPPAMEKTPVIFALLKLVQICVHMYCSVESILFSFFASFLFLLFLRLSSGLPSCIFDFAFEKIARARARRRKGAATSDIHPFASIVPCGG